MEGESNPDSLPLKNSSQKLEKEIDLFYSENNMLLEKVFQIEEFRELIGFVSEQFFSKDMNFKFQNLI